MKKLAILTALLTFGITLAGCGGKADTVEAEKATTPTTANTAAANANTTAAQTGRDADDRIAVNATTNTNAGSTARADRDRNDVRSGKTNADSNSTNLRRDADDRGKHDNYRDTDRDADDQ